MLFRSIIEINKIQIGLYSGNGTYTIQDAVDLINAETTNHKVTAEKVGAATEVLSDFNDYTSAYGVIAGYVPFSITINNVQVNFTTTTSGSAAYGDPSVAALDDMIADINAAGVPDIIASSIDGTYLKLRNNSGGQINIGNLSTDSNGNNFAGQNSISSLPLNTPANTITSALKLSRQDGGPMTIRDFSGQFLSDAGVLSGQTGRYALGLNIEQGLRSSSTTMVATIAARDALHALPGDQSYVIDAGNNEWATFVFDGIQWLQIGNQRSNATDAKTLTLEVDLTTLSSSGTQQIGFVSTNRRILDIDINMSGSDGSSNSVAVYAHHNNEYVELMSTDDSDLTTDGEYTTTSNFKTQGQTEILADITVVSNVGMLTINVTYV